MDTGACKSASEVIEKQGRKVCGIKEKNKKSDLVRSRERR